MGVWGLGNFENDTALDWVYSFENSPMIEFLEITVDILLHEKEYLDADLVFETLASLEIVAGIKGNKSNDFPTFSIIDFEEIANKLNQMVTPDFLFKCESALSRITKSDNNEIIQLLEEGNKLQEWSIIQENLKTRLFQ